MRGLATACESATENWSWRTAARDSTSGRTLLSCGKLSCATISVLLRLYSCSTGWILVRRLDGRDRYSLLAQPLAGAAKVRAGHKGRSADMAGIGTRPPLR